VWKGRRRAARKSRAKTERKDGVALREWPAALARAGGAAGRRAARDAAASRSSAPRRAGPDGPGRDAGFALLMALLVTMFLAAVCGALLLLASTETRIAGAEEVRREARGVAEVLLERVLQELLEVPDWTAVLAGSAAGGFRDATVTPRVAGWGVLDLQAVTLNVQREADDSNRWGSDGPRWQLYAFGPAGELFGGAGAGAGSGSAGPARAAALYVVAWLADDPGEGDGNPAADRNDTLQVRAEAFGPMRTRQALVATVRRKSGVLQVVAWRTPELG